MAVYQFRITAEPDDPSESRDRPKSETITASADRQTNMRAIVGALGIVDRLRGVLFDWKPEGKRGIGFIPEEVAEVLPDAVAFDNNGKDTKAIDFGPLVADLIEAVKEQQVQIKNHEHSLKDQKAQVARLRAEIERLKVNIRAATVR